MDVSVIIPTHNPHEGRLRRALAGLVAQTLSSHRWEALLIDNASRSPVDASKTPAGNFRLIRESKLGLTSARRRGLTEARAPLVVFVDDDNVLTPDYLTHVIRLFTEHPKLGAAGGKSMPEFEIEPPSWTREFLPLLALRDLGEIAAITTTLRPAGSARNEYPATAPIGAGMALRKEAMQTWLADQNSSELTDRRGSDLSSGGDNDIVLTLLAHGWHVGYFPELSLTHLIPGERLTTDYLARLNRGIQRSWMQVLTRHAANPWPLIPRWTVPLRQAKAWLAYRPWSSVAARIRWKGACGHFEGRGGLHH